MISSSFAFLPLHYISRLSSLPQISNSTSSKPPNSILQTSLQQIRSPFPTPMHPEQDPSPSPSPSPFPSPNPSSFLRDISNFKTPKTSFQNPNPNPNPLFFTASKQTAFSSTTTPSSSASALRRRPTSALPSRSKAARCLKALELEQSQSSRKAQIRRQKSIEAQSRSISVWLNFLFRNPRLCGCDAFVWNGADKSESVEGVAGRKRESLKGGPRVGTDRAWRSPKRQRPAVDAAFSVGKAVLGFASLEASLRDVCSFEDLVERMGMYLSPDSQNEVLSVMSRVVKVSFSVALLFRHFLCSLQYADFVVYSWCKVSERFPQK